MNFAFDWHIYSDRQKPLNMNPRRLRIGVLIGGIALLMVGMAPAVLAAGQISCLSPSSCASISTISLTGPGSTGTATFWLHAVPTNPGTVYYYVCPSTASSCSSTSGSDNGWSWTFTPATGTTGTGSPCESGANCEGNGLGSPNTLTLSITAPSVVTSTNQVEDLAIYACSGTASVLTCDSEHATVATESVTATVPQFALGFSVAVAAGLVGLVMLRRLAAPKTSGSASLGI